MIYCWVCGLANRDGSRFCNYCGRRVDALVECSACGAPNPVASRFCSECGFGLAGAQPRVLARTVAPDALPPLTVTPSPAGAVPPPAASPATALAELEPFNFPEPEGDEPDEAEAPTLEGLLGSTPPLAESRPEGTRPAPAIALAGPPEVTPVGSRFERPRFEAGPTVWESLVPAAGPIAATSA